MPPEAPTIRTILSPLDVSALSKLASCTGETKTALQALPECLCYRLNRPQVFLWHTVFGIPLLPLEGRQGSRRLPVSGTAQGLSAQGGVSPGLCFTKNFPDALVIHSHAAPPLYPKIKQAFADRAWQHHLLSTVTATLLSS
jgi:hypothetical protein